MSSAHRNAQSGVYPNYNPQVPQHPHQWRSGRLAYPPYTMSESSSNTSSIQGLVVSPRGLFRVPGYNALEGLTGGPITISLTFFHRANETTFLRLVLGRRALTTKVCQLSSKTYSWELQAFAPPSDNSACPATPVPLSVQALSGNGFLLDSVVVGSFCYTDHSSAPQDTTLPNGLVSQVPHPEPLGTLVDQAPRPLSLPRSSFTVVPSSRPHTPSSRPTMPRSRSTRPATTRPKKKQTLMRTRRLSPGRGSPESHRVTLDFTTPVESVCVGWDKEEMKTGRRLVRFSGKLEDFCLKISSRCIKQEEYSEGDSVISCIYRRDTGKCYVTSVDIICLLESLVGESFEIEEKNRIRRNLEGFRPKTVSKNRAGSEDFFQQIMDFPSPKPRNIEKDVKVFDWNILPQALDKIISKYSLYTYSSDSPESSPSLHGSELPVTETGPTLIPSFTTNHADNPSSNPFFYVSNNQAFPPNVFTSHLPDVHFTPNLSRANTLDSFASSTTPPLSVSSSPRSVSPFGETTGDMQFFSPAIARSRSIPISRHSSLDRACPLETFQSTDDDFSTFNAVQYSPSFQDSGSQYV